MSTENNIGASDSEARAQQAELEEAKQALNDGETVGGPCTGSGNGCTGSCNHSSG